MGSFIQQCPIQIAFKSNAFIYFTFTPWVKEDDDFGCILREGRAGNYDIHGVSKTKREKIKLKQKIF